MSRAIWKGTITFGLVSIPIGLHTVEKTRHERVALHLYDKKTMAPVGNRMVNKDTGDEIERKDVVKGFEQDGEVVVLTQEDIDAAKVAKNQQIEIASFAKREEIPLAYFERPYWIEPQKGGRKSYALLRAALADGEYAGIATVVISTKQYLAAVLPAGDDALMLMLLRWAHEVKDAGELDLPHGEKGDKPSAKEVEMARRLIQEMVEPFAPEQFADHTREALLAIVDAKKKAGKARAAPKVKGARAEPGDIMTLLRRSLEESAPTTRKRTAAPHRAAHAGGKRKRARA